MMGSSASIADSNVVLNTIVADSLGQFADVLETSGDFKNDLHALVVRTIREHKRIIFNGNNYSEQWITEAKKRGLSNLVSSVDALPAWVSPKSVKLFSKHRVFTEAEIRSRYEILMEGYCKTIHVEALTMLDMVRGEIIPACIDYQNDLAKLLKRKKACGQYDVTLEDYLLGNIAKLSSCLLKQLSVLENTLLVSKENRDIVVGARFYREQVYGSMAELRLIIDELETLVARKYWSFPTYGQILYSVT